MKTKTNTEISFYPSLSPYGRTGRWTDRQTDRLTEKRIYPGCPGHPDGFLQVDTLLLYPSLSPHGRTDGGTNTLALRGLEEPAHALRGLEEPFSSCADVSVFGSGKK